MLLPTGRGRLLSRLLLAGGLLAAPVLAPSARAQAGALLSPGPLSRAHAQLEGLANCAKCHEPGRQVTAARCLSCHRPIAERIAARKGVHRNASNDCVRCHSEHNGVNAELRPFDARHFDHATETGFPLDGRHAALAGNCAKCHSGRSFLQARPACTACHADAHRGGLGQACTACHTTAAAFTDARRTFDHDRAKFRLVGAHRALDCARCHADKTFAGLRFASCTDCHKSPHREILAANCTACHGNETWRTQKVDHARTAFPLRGRHENVPCASCHKASPVKVRLEFSRCAACHVDVHRGQFKEDCAACHRETGFRSVPFDHDTRTRFALTGRHVGLPCARCHPNARTVADAAPPPGPRPTTAGRETAPASAVLFGGASSACVSCHTDPHTGQTGTECTRCHTTSDFRAGPYTHDARLAAFFAGRHAAASCVECHGLLAARPMAGARPAAASPADAGPRTPVARWRFKGLGTRCATCHADPHEGQLGGSCETCHAIDETRFSASLFSHARTGFPLTGKHQAVECARCHRQGPAPNQPPAIKGGAVSSLAEPPRQPAVSQAAWQEPGPPPPAPRQRPLTFKAMGTDCASCHADVHLGQLGTRCQQCHGPETFRVASFTHTGKWAPAFFTGTHNTLTCRACHKPEQARFPAGTGTAVRYVGQGTACAACHATDDSHRGALGNTCEACHKPAGWRSASRAFHKAGLFPLEGRHLSVACAQCHVNGVTKGTPTACFDCHWNRRQDDRYHTRLGTQCEQCHRPTAWTAVQFNHAASTGLPLSAAHQGLRCDSCHRDGRFAATANDCYSCHRAAYDRTTQPNHAAAGFPTNCQVCHAASQTSWLQATFDHRSIFPLVGVHATQPCAACHKNQVYAGTARDCVGCHRADYQRTTSPNHAAAGFPTTCEACHRASDPSWAGAGFNHASVFPLLGVHATQPCAACHKNGVFAGTPRDCLGCHQADYQRTTNPNHAAAGFPTACDTCHSASNSSWAASFNHNRFYPLLGRHLQQPCSACHQNNVYAGTPTDCYACHRSAYQSAANPNHIAAGFPTSCQPCHQPADSTWQQGKFNHTWFPITSGPHAGNPCSACHTSSSNFASFSCTVCHGRATTDSHHSGVSGYRYDSAACYACHPNGRAGD